MVYVGYLDIIVGESYTKKQKCRKLSIKFDVLHEIQYSLVGKLIQTYTQGYSKF
jgi:hypothetical protein